MNLKYVLAFVCGAGIGFATSYGFLKKKYEKRIKEEVESVKNTYKNFYTNQSEKDTNTDCKYCPENETNVMFSEPLAKETYEFEESEECDEEQDMGSYKKTIKDEYNVDEENEYRDPYVIAPEQYGEDIDYHLVELTYYAGDNKLVDEDWRVIKNVEELVGKDALSSFGEYEDDAVHVRNERLQTEYEILLDERKYEDVMNK